MEEKITLAIESSCDETSAAVLKGGRQVLSNIISTQIPIHQKFGGVVPEIASRKHIVNIMPVIDEALEKAQVKLADVDQIAVTYGPGLVGALLVGVSAAKALAFTLGVPLIGVNHLEGHIFANFLSDATLEPPFVALVASGGHTALVHVKDYNTFLAGTANSAQEYKDILGGFKTNDYSIFLCYNIANPNFSPEGTCVGSFTTFAAPGPDWDDLPEEEYFKFKDAWANKFLDSLKESVNVPFERVLYALGIRHIGQANASMLASHFGNIDNLMSATRDELLHKRSVRIPVD